jgi:hypothetical protein
MDHCVPIVVFAPSPKISPEISTLAEMPKEVEADWVNLRLSRLETSLEKL